MTQTIKLSDLLTPLAGARMVLNLSAVPPSPDDPESFGRAALEISTHRTDRWRLAVLLMSFEGLMTPVEAATICVAMGEHPTMDTAREAVGEINPSLAEKILTAVRVVAEADE